jgi:hypothetical protein
MILVKRLPWVLLGLVIGVGFGMAPSIKAQERAAQPQTLIPHPDISIGYNEVLFFVSDSKTHSCWLAARARGVLVGLASAPPEACQ